MTTSLPPIALPSSWPERGNSGLVHAIALARLGPAQIHARCAESRRRCVQLTVENDRLRGEVGMLREELRIKDARMARLAAANCPHYPAAERLAVLELKAARGWNNQQTARAFLVTAATIRQLAAAARRARRRRPGQNPHPGQPLPGLRGSSGAPAQDLPAGHG
jgi:hypothetical protein